VKVSIDTEKRILGLDIGSKKIGIAVSDLLRIIATPHSTLLRKSPNQDTEKLCHLIKEYDIGGIVVGLPLEMSGEEGKSCQMVREFIKRLLIKIELPVAFIDERYSTSAVYRALNETNFTRKRKEELDDKLAASYILQGYLDKLNTKVNSNDL
jgi:putative Holliday junction resolvase